MRDKWNAKEPYVPVSDNGSLQKYAHPYRNNQQWLAWVPHEMTLEITGFTTGRSAATAHFKHEDGRTFPMFLSDFEKLILNGHFNKQFVTEKWTVRKAGSNYGLVMADDI